MAPINSVLSLSFCASLGGVLGAGAVDGGPAAAAAAAGGGPMGDALGGIPRGGICAGGYAPGGGGRKPALALDAILRAVVHAMLTVLIVSIGIHLVCNKVW